MKNAYNTAVCYFILFICWIVGPIAWVVKGFTGSICWDCYNLDRWMHDIKVGCAKATALNADEKATAIIEKVFGVPLR